MAQFDGGQPSKRLKTNDTNERGFEEPGFYNFGGPNQGNNATGGGRQSRRDEEARINHILLMTVMNPNYPITVDVIHTITSPLGKVLRIVIFKKNGVQAMVEFDSIESARKARQSLNGADIYSGCCTLKIEYAKPDRLNVYKNDGDSWDYTNPNLGANQSESRDRPGPLLQDPPRRGGAPQPYRGGGGGANGGGGGRGPGGGNMESGPPNPRRGGFGGVDPNFQGGYEEFGGPNNYGMEPYPPRRRDDHGMDGPPSRGRDWNEPGLLNQPRFVGPRGDGGNNEGFRNGGPPRNRGPPPLQGRQSYGNYPQEMYGEGSAGGVGGGGGDEDHGSVMMVYGLDPVKVNSDSLFNLFCLYGNVLKVKFLKTKEGCAMVQMGNSSSVHKTVYNLNNLDFFGKKMQLAFSKQAFLNDVQNPFTLPDGSPSFVSYVNNRNNRFLTPEAAAKNRISQPSKMVHFFNTPFGVTEDELNAIFAEKDVNPPATIKMFPSKSERSSSGLMEFGSETEAIEAVVTCNHYSLPPKKGAKFPFTMKLCFSSVYKQ